MEQSKSYIVRVGRKGGRCDADVFGIVEELDAGREQVCETLEEFIAILEDRARTRPPRKQTFDSFEELTRILNCFCEEEAVSRRPRLHLVRARGREGV